MTPEAKDYLLPHRLYKTREARLFRSLATNLGHSGEWSG